MQLSLLFSFASLVLSQELDIKQNLACFGGHHQAEHQCNEHCAEHNERKSGKPCLLGKCPGACICSAKNKEHYPNGVKPCHEEQVVTKVHVETGCVTDYKVHTSKETLTKVVDHCHTETAVWHPEQTYTLTRTESYVVWPAATSQVCGGHKAPCAHHGKGKAGCCL